LVSSSSESSDRMAFVLRLGGWRVGVPVGVGVAATVGGGSLGRETERSRLDIPVSEEREITYDLGDILVLLVA
jgi:hypothetical protein